MTGGAWERGTRLRDAAGWIDAVAESWIGYSMPAPDRWLRCRGWRHDERRDYCGRCGQSVGDGEATMRGCGGCRTARRCGHGVVRLGAYGGTLRDAVRRVKYERWFEMGALLGRHLGEAAQQSALVERGQCVVVPMPMPWQRRARRGIDHARVIADGVAAAIGAPVRCAIERRNGPAQSTLASGARRRLGGRGMRIGRRRRRIRAGSHVVLVDDVLTTGASCRAAVGHLTRLQPARVVVAVVAVSDPPGRRSPPDGC